MIFWKEVPGDPVSRKQRKGRGSRFRRGVYAFMKQDGFGDADNAEGNDFQDEWIAPYAEVLGVALAACDLEYSGAIPCVSDVRLREAQEDLVAFWLLRARRRLWPAADTFGASRGGGQR